MIDQPNLELENPSSTNSKTENSEAVEAIIETPMASMDVLSPGAVIENIFSEAEFTDFFVSLFPAAGAMAGMLYPPEWQSLTMAPNLPTCRPAAGALYRMALKNSWLRFLIEKETEWMKDMIIVGSFGVTVAMGVRSEFEARKHPRQGEVPKGEAGA